MKVEDIIKEVRWCIDEESNNFSSITDEKDDLYMDNIIKAKINDAMHWIAVTASSSSALVDSKKIGTSSATLQVQDYDTQRSIGVVTMDANTEVINQIAKG